MACVRDIEAHDVLDNLGIESIVPDLSLVKIEPPAEDDTDNERIVPDLSLVKIEPPSEDDTENEEEDANYCYYYDNVIPSGSKPSPDIEFLYEEACISTYCDHCSKTFPDDSALIEHLQELQTHNNLPKGIEEKNKDYKIKVIEPESGYFKILTGNNRGENGGNTGLRKRKLENSEENGALVKKVRKTLSDPDTSLSERRSSRGTINRAATARDVRIDVDNTLSEIIVSDEISIRNNFNIVSDIDMQTVWIITGI